MNQINAGALDRWITGNYGEDHPDNKVCETCDGEGYIDVDTGNPEDSEDVPCPDCNGG